MSTGFDGPIEALQEQSRQLAQSDAARQQWFCEVAEKSNVVQRAEQIWIAAIDARESSRHVDEGGKIVAAHILEEQDEQIERSILCARILRNAVVGLPNCQELCYEAVPSIIRVLWITTSFTFDNDKQVHMFNRTLVQLLSNLVTLNEELQDRLWYQTICNDKDDGPRTGADLFGRLLQSSDAATSSAAQVLLLNCTLESSQRCTSLSTSRAGTKLLSSMLEIVQQHLQSDEEDGGEEEHPVIGSNSATFEHKRKQTEGLGVLYAFFTNLFDRQLFGSVFVLLSPVEVAGQESITSLVNQSQLALLKLLDTYLYYGALSYRKDTTDSNAPTDGFEELMENFEKLAKWATKVMREALQGGSKGHVDPRLVEVHIALLLMLQCLITLGLKTENEEREQEEIGLVAKEMLGKMRSVSFVQLLVSLLHTLAEFAPPISPFRPTNSSPKKAPDQPPPGHTLSSTGAAAATDASESGPGLDYLKRDIVNLLGVLSYKRRSDSKEAVLLVQDTVREGGGLFDVLNMTQLDEHNPYIRERAIFTLRNLLLDNQVSQDVVAKLKPVPR